ncbi:insulin-like growth factor 2 mRNA-binding protein 3 isoform X3 [Lingula anatina]|uniref:Insulin-like growth factor 2 mRNA-binding protein 3 isoform X3 n=1 Tax=Lingula anatina TaxID=7574 RepID=A0A1S3J577_LINAN|nr:insulin-like growth factor 2 mRNA-binding protein 3 isoform X3 [Lingula anatina]|eukprot:XP_013405582.1 insulin-like growth factor 2 mRNA-binding protein 3 isoform X3 [Lingula anatina]
MAGYEQSEQYEPYNNIQSEENDNDYNGHHESGQEDSSNSRTAKIIIRHVPSQVTHEDLLRLVSAFGPVIKTDESTNRNGENVVVVIYESPEAAQEAASQLNGYELLGTQISVELAAPRNNRRFGGRRNFSGMGSNRNSDFPLRILVPREMVGAVIGRGGETVRQITQQSRAR